MRVCIYSQVPLSIFEPPLILRNRGRDRPIEFGIQTARLCQIAVRAGELRGLKNNILVVETTTVDGMREEAAVHPDRGRLPWHAAETDP